MGNEYRHALGAVGQWTRGNFDLRVLILRCFEIAGINRYDLSGTLAASFASRDDRC